MGEGAGGWGPPPAPACTTAPSPSRYRIGMAPLSLLLLLDVPISSSSLVTLVNLGTRTCLLGHQRPQPINNGTYWAQHSHLIPSVLCWYLYRWPASEPAVSCPRCAAHWNTELGTVLGSPTRAAFKNLILSIINSCPGPLRQQHEHRENDRPILLRLLSALTACCRLQVALLRSSRSSRRPRRPRHISWTSLSPSHRQLLKASTWTTTPETG